MESSARWYSDMAQSDDKEQRVQTELGVEIRRIRQILGLSLRDVEEKSGVSNAYLSQLETGTIMNPSPHILLKLAEVLRVPYELLMERAGYIQRSVGKKALTGAALSTFKDLTRDEEAALMEYLAFLRSRRKTKQGKGDK
jgi:transcriptional regulator with XRE-family HTH domain